MREASKPKLIFLNKIQFSRFLGFNFKELGILKNWGIIEFDIWTAQGWSSRNNNACVCRKPRSSVLQAIYFGPSPKNIIL